MVVKDTAQKEKFIQLRAKGFSFDKIAKEIGASKPTPEKSFVMGIHPQMGKSRFADKFLPEKKHPQICKYHFGDVFLS